MLVQFPGGTVIHTGPSFIPTMPTKDQGVTNCNNLCLELIIHGPLIIKKEIEEIECNTTQECHVIAL